MFKKGILLFTLVMMSMSFTSCSSDVVVDAKVKVASEIKDVVEKELNDAFKDITVEGVDCSVEATAHAQYMYDKTAEFLKIPSEDKALSSMTSLGVLQKACVYVVDKGFRYLIDKSGDSSPCLKELGRVKIIELADKSCENLE